MKHLFAFASLLSVAIILAGCGKKSDKDDAATDKKGGNDDSLTAGAPNGNQGGKLPPGTLQGDTNPPDNNGNNSPAAVTWMTSYSDAIAESRKSSKPVLVNFTGKKWCGWCIRLRNEVFDTAEFKQWAADNVVLLELDFPRTGTLPENLKLARKYGVRGYPTIKFINAEGAVYGKSGYLPGGPQNWIGSAKRILANTNPIPVASLSTGGATTKPAGTGDLTVPKLTWLTSFSTALEESKKSNKPVMVNFTGKAWCGWCIRLRREVFETAQFKQWADKSVVLLELDFPRSGRLPENEALRKKYNVRGYPTIMFINSEGAIIGKTGYVAGGPDKWLTTAKSALANTSPTPVAGLSTGGSSSGSAGSLPAAKSNWLTSYTKALSESKKLGKPVLANFTGKKWCGWCIRLRQEVFETAEFKQWADKSVVLLELDFPRTGTPPQNRRLASKYKVQGYPTILFLNSEGAILGKSGYLRGGPDAWLAKANRALANTSPTSPGEEGSTNAGGTSHAPGSAEYAVFQLISSLKKNDVGDLSQFICSDAKGLMKKLISAKPSASDLKRARTLFRKAKATKENAKQVSANDHRFTLLNDRGVSLVFKCRKEDGKFKISEMLAIRSR